MKVPARSSKYNSRKSSPRWQGVFPAITTQMHRDGSLDIEATARHAEALIENGITGLVILRSLGENQMLTPEEKRLMVRELVRAVGGRMPLLSGIAETSTAEACRYARDCEALGADAKGVANFLVFDKAIGLRNVQVAENKPDRDHPAGI